MPIFTKEGKDFVNDQVTEWASQYKPADGTTVSPNLVSGDPFLAFFQAVTGQLLHLQAQVLLVNAFARASTCSGEDLDSWVADWGLITRNPARKANGPAVFGVKMVRSEAVQVPVGTIIQTVGGAIQYEVIADTERAAYSVTQNAYILSPGQTSVEVTVQALIGGTQYNLASPNLLKQIASNAVGVDTVTNAQPITNGFDVEGDDDFRDRFVLALASLSKATKQAFESAIRNLQQGLFFSLLDNQDINGVEVLGMVTVVLDDGSGATPGSLLLAAHDSLETVRAFGVEHHVIAAIKVEPSIALNIRISPQSVVSSAVIQQAVIDAIVVGVDKLNIGETLYLSKIVRWAEEAHADILGVQPNSVTINATEADLTPTYKQVIKIVGANVTVGTY